MLQRQIANDKKTYVLLAMFTAYCVLNESYKIHYEERIKQLDKEIEMLKQQKGEL
jgi:cell division protein ZapA (FtsZ GTPase activity inhibitor)